MLTESDVVSNEEAEVLADEAYGEAMASIGTYPDAEIARAAKELLIAKLSQEVFAA